MAGQDQSQYLPKSSDTNWPVVAAYGVGAVVVIGVVIGVYKIVDRAGNIVSSLPGLGNKSILDAVF